MKHNNRNQSLYSVQKLPVLHLALVLILCVSWLIQPAAAQAASGTARQTARTAASTLASSDWDSIIRQIRAAEYQFAYHDPTSETSQPYYWAPNRDLGWQVNLSRAGLDLQPQPVAAEAAPSWRLKLNLAAYGSSGGLKPAPEPILTANKTSLNLKWGPDLQETYTNTPGGLDHSFRVEHPLSGQSNLLVLELSAAGSLALTLNSGPNGEVLWTDSAGDPLLTSSRWQAQDALGRTLRVDTSMPASGKIRLEVDAGDAAYPLSLNSLVSTFVLKKTTPDDLGNNSFGEAVSISGDTMLIGASYYSMPGGNSSGAAYIFVRSQGGKDNWGLVKQLLASDPANGDYFGSSVSLDGGSALVGAPGKKVGASNGQGAAFLFSRNQGGEDNWGRVGILNHENGAFADRFGTSVSLSGDVALVGAESRAVNGNTNQGAAYIFYRNYPILNGWSQVKELTDANSLGAGVSVSLQGDTALVGADFSAVNGVDGAGSALIFMRNQGGADNWGLVHSIKPSDPATGDRFGHSVSLSGDTALIGAYFDDVGANENQGSAYVFMRNKNGPNVWGQVRKILAPAGAAFEEFGTQVALNGDTGLIGIPNRTTAGLAKAGSAYLFERNQGGADHWGAANSFAAPDGAANDTFGSAVALSAKYVLIGARTSNSYAGAAYLFLRKGSTWVSVNQPYASDSAIADHFGWSVSLSGDKALIGAVHDDVGSNPNQGSAYILYRNQTGADAWGQAVKLTAADGSANDHFGAAVSLDNNKALVGAPDHDHALTGQGAVYLFFQNASAADSWDQVRELLAPNPEANESFGSSVSLSQDTALIGAPNRSVAGKAGQGVAYIIDRNLGGPDHWNALAELTAGDGAAGYHFGAAVSLDNDLALVGAPQAAVLGRVGQGVAYLFGKNVGGLETWGQMRHLIAANGQAGDAFGSAVSLDLDTALVGSPQTDIGLNANQGAAYIYSRNTGGADQWGQDTQLYDGGGSALDRYGASVSLSGDAAMVGAPDSSINANSSQGSVFIYVRKPGWVYLMEIFDSNGSANDQYGYSVSLDGNQALVGAPFSLVNSPGSAFVLRYDYNLHQVFLPVVRR